MLKRIGEKLEIPVSLLAGSEEDILTGKNLQGLREERGLTLEDLSEICDIPAALLARFEEGSINPDDGHLSRLSSGLNVTIRYFQERPGGNSLGAKIKKIRLDGNLTVAVLAEKAGVSPGLISQIENGQTTPHLETLEAIARVLNTSPAHLLMEGGDVEDLAASFSPDMLEIMEDPGVQSVLRSLRDLSAGEIKYIFNYISFFRANRSLLT